MPTELAWAPASPCRQLSLFPVELGPYLLKLGIRWHDVIEWQRRGWLLAGRDPLSNGLDEPEALELLFIRDLVRTPLEPSQVDAVLRRADRPLSLDPTEVAYHFHREEWLQVPSRATPGDIVAENWRELLEDWGQAWGLERMPALLLRTEGALYTGIRKRHCDPPNSKPIPFNALAHPDSAVRPIFWLTPRRRERNGDNGWSAGPRVVEALGIHADELAAWQQRGWLSRELVDSKPEDFDSAQVTELLFITGLARSCLRWEQVDRLLEPLLPPYRYADVVWSPRFGLVTCASVLETSDFIEDHWEAAIEELMLRGDRDVVHEILHGLRLRVGRTDWAIA